MAQLRAAAAVARSPQKGERAGALSPSKAPLQPVAGASLAAWLWKYRPYAGMLDRCVALRRGAVRGGRKGGGRPLVLSPRGPVWQARRDGEKPCLGDASCAVWLCASVCGLAPGL